MRTTRISQENISPKVEKVLAPAESTPASVSESSNVEIHHVVPKQIEGVNGINNLVLVSNGEHMNTLNNSEVIVKKYLSSERKLKKIGVGRVLISIVLGLIFSSLIFSLVGMLYISVIKYPEEQVIDENSTGLYCLQQWQGNLKDLSSLGEDSYISKEVVYANGSQIRVNFYKQMLATVKYSPQMQYKKDTFGNEYIDRDTNSYVVEVSNVSVGEEVRMDYIDYTKVHPTTAEIEFTMKKYNLSYGDVNYSDKLIDVFCEYMLNMFSMGMFEYATVYRVPNMGLSEGKYVMLPEEDIYIDSLLFSSKEFFDLLERFSVEAAKVSGMDLKPLDTWVAWNSLSTDEMIKIPEPTKYGSRDIISKDWCGTYYLQNEYKGETVLGDLSGLVPKLGDGTKNNPASFNTGVVTSVFVGTDTYPIKVTLLKYGVSQNAIAWFESKDTRNRGIDVTSETQYCYYVFEIENLSNRVLTINDNSGLCDLNANMSPRTGVIYGLQDSVTLQPGEKGFIESWNKSTELNKKYVIWGSDFKRRAEPVWFRLLMGDLEDTSINKGVLINNSRN